MRVKLTLSCLPDSIIPLDNRYALSSVIYNIIQSGSKEFSLWLHNQGYNFKGRSFKFFTFGNLKPERYEIQKNVLKIKSALVVWELSFFEHEILDKIITGIFSNKEFSLGSRFTKNVKFNIDKVEAIKMPEFRQTMRYRSLTPILLGKIESEIKYEQYLSPLYIGYEDIFLHNLSGKVAAATGVKDNTMAKFKLLSPAERVKPKGFTIEKANLKPMHFRPYLFDFELYAPPLWHQVGYYAGFGQDNSLGLGFCEISH